jgi:hypothetical protein
MSTEDKYTHKHRRFLDLILDALVLLHEATKAENITEGLADEPRDSIPFKSLYLADALSRSSIMSAVASLECAANCCVESISTLPPIVTNHFDRLQTMDKFEVFCCCHLPDNFVKLERSRAEYQKAKELIQIRNWYVHPKSSLTLHRIGASDEPTEWNEWKAIQIQQSGQWNSEDASKVLDAVILFFNWFFLDVCGLSASQTSELLMSSWNTTEGDLIVRHYEQEKESQLLKSGRDIRFLDLADEWVGKDPWDDEE